MRAKNTTLLLLACAWPMAAQETGKPPVHEKDKPMTDTMTHGDKAMVVKGETVFGADLRSGGEDVGDIKDFIVDRDGQISYVILGIDKGDDRLVAVPWKALKTVVSKDDPNDYEFDVLVDKARLATAPTFNKDKWPNLASADWARETDAFFHDVADLGRGARPAGTPTDEGAGARPAGMAKALAFRGKKLQGCQVATSSGANAGEIENLAIDPKNGRVAFVVLSTGGFLGLGEDHHAVPMQAFTFTREDNDDLDCKLNIPESKLENAPKFSKSDWDAADDVVFIEKVYTHYGYPAYWSDRPMPATGKEEPVRKPGEEDKGDR